MTVGIVGGSDLVKISEQLGSSGQSPIFHMFFKYSVLFILF